MAAGRTAGNPPGCPRDPSHGGQRSGDTSSSRIGLMSASRGLPLRHLPLLSQSFPAARGGGSHEENL
jgi:hypothetical protein